MNDIGYALRNLIAVYFGQLDEAYMRKWAVDLGVLPLLEKTLADAKPP